MTIGSLFAGIGGFDLAARWMGWRTAWYSEIDPYASAVMRKHWPDAPNHGDIRLIKGDKVERVDILCGGFPCQDISHAGTREGIDGERSGLWSEYVRLIRELQPKYVVAENVSALRSRGLARVLEDLMAVGYDAEWHCIPATYAGANHIRDRIWIVAYPRDFTDAQADTPALPIGEVRDAWQNDCRSRWTPAPRIDWEVPQPRMGRMADAFPSRVERGQCIGNAIVPDIAHLLFQAIAEHERMAPHRCGRRNERSL